MTDLVAKHRKALQRVKGVGVAVTFTRFEQTYDPETDSYGEPTEFTVAGWAVEAIGSEEVIGANTSTTLEEELKLLFVPNTYGELPQVGSRVVWSGETRTVRKVDPIRPAGTALAAHVEIV